MHRTVIVCILFVTGCVPIAAHVAGPAAGVAFEYLASAHDEQAEAASHEAAERKRLRDNEQIRMTTARLHRERHIAMALEPRRVNEPSHANDSPVPARTPSRLDAAMIQEGVAPVKADVMRCRGGASVKGNVLVAVKVAPEGHVLDVQIKTTPDPTLGSCVGATVRTAMFARTETGGSFRYPFVF